MSDATTGELPGELTCRELVELVTEYLEGALAPDERTRFELHLAVCHGCTQYLHQLRATLRIAGRLSEESLPDEARASLLRAFREWKRRPPGGA
ncbi:anti-sigma factor family protein [Anaeromyxobacter terrae]|uniref:anti-sigma factor family protein n=1 Tax=Anaeromyxobacter terrae TaxID=2925406 RepID=UPI001F5A1DF0|nr:zf-HC2 domain-containing protein [Anaeromyxobacter sp. SG22]